MHTVIYLVRHGETDWNREQRCQGHTDIPLNEVGMTQAEKLGERLKTTQLHTIYASDLTRARQTAERIAEHQGLDVITQPNLRERSYGEWEGMTLAQIRAQYPDHRTIRLEGGQYGIEPFTTFQERIVNQVHDIALSHTGKAALIVSHGGSINAFLHAITAGKMGTGKTTLNNTGVTQVVYHQETGWDVITVNDVEHLSG